MATYSTNTNIDSVFFSNVTVAYPGQGPVPTITIPTDRFFKGYVSFNTALPSGQSGTFRVIDSNNFDRLYQPGVLTSPAGNTSPVPLILEAGTYTLESAIGTRVDVAISGFLYKVG